jgi:hypothetical protein
MRATMKAIFYLLRTGCPWRFALHDPFLRRSTVDNIFRKFQHEGGVGRDLGGAARGLARTAGPPELALPSETMCTFYRRALGASRDDDVGRDAGRCSFARSKK